MNVLDLVNPKRVFHRLAEIFGPRKTIIALGVGGGLAAIGMTTVFIAYPDDVVNENNQEEEN